jgi:hypothetical protein
MIYPASLHGSDVFGVNRFAHLVNAIEPQLVVLHQDSWNVLLYLQQLARLDAAKQPPILAWCPADAKNQWAAREMNGRIARLLAPTDFGVQALIDGGFRGPTGVLPYGIDTNFFTPGNAREARQALHFHDPWLDDFIIGRADRNAARKRYDLTLQYFARWWSDTGKPENVRLMLHCALADPYGWDLNQLAYHFGFPKQRLMFTDMDLDAGVLWPREKLPNVYRSWDVHWSLTHGEGFGLVAMESAACGIPQILPDTAAYGDLFRGTARLMPTSMSHVVPCGANTVGEVVGYDAAAAALSDVYDHADLRRDLAVKAYELATLPDFQWDAIADQFHTYCQETIDGR